MKYCYIVAEGHQDIEFLIRLLKNNSLKRVIKKEKLDPYWYPLIPTSFPIDGDLMKRAPVPLFLQSADLSIALQSANGIQRVTDSIEETLALIDINQIFGLAIFLDADSQETPQDRFEEIKMLLSAKLPTITWPNLPGEVTETLPKRGVFIAPNNLNQGTLEDILLECAQENYPTLLTLASAYIHKIPLNDLTTEDLKELCKTAGKNKAIIASIAGVLKPGKALQVTIQDNRWVDEKTRSLPTLQTLVSFLKKITGLEETPAP
ncbi:MAG: hypothetical protein GC158_12595 [Cyanobacteria bacterium RI_101]|nr:hypothetical protein [Cyanobacteria bacterium RI_101]